MPLSSYSYQGDFLSPFCANGRNLVTQMFCKAVRGGCDTVDEVLAWVARDRVRRIEEVLPQNYQVQTMQSLADTLDAPEARGFAQFIMDRESLSREDRERLKQDRRAEYRAQWYENQRKEQSA